MRSSTLSSSILCLLLGAGQAWAGEHKPCDDSADHCLTEMARYYRSTGWVGISIEPDGHGRYVVTEVWPGSPALEAGFEKDDVLVAFEGVAYAPERKAELAKLQKTIKLPGKEVTYTVRRGGRELEIRLELVAVPEKLIAQWVGRHMLDGHAEEVRTADKDP